MKVQGWASTSDLDHYRHVVVPSAFAASVTEKGTKGPKGIKLLHAHDTRRVLGRITKLEPRNRGLWIEADIDEGISYAKDVALSIKAQGGLSFSVGFLLVSADIEETTDGREYLRILEGDLLEVSVVTEPGNSEAVITQYEG